ncbi:MAG: hypothetical protein EOO96_30040, partial [Pedobacter sp.]
MEQKLFKKTLSKTITAIAILAVGLSSCKKNIENQNPESVKTFNTKQEAKAYINQKLIYPADSAADALISAHPITSDLSNSDQLFDQLL